MLRVLAAALLVAACSTESIPDAPPVLEVTSPARGSFADSDTVTVSGRVIDDGKVRVTVAGTEVTPAADGTFTATVTVPPGIGIIETHAIDANHDVRDVRAVLAGTLAPTDGTAPAQIGARAGVTALRAVGNAVATSAKAIDYTAVAKAMNPVYNNTGCLGAVVNITSVTISDVGVALAPASGHLATDVAISNVVVKMNANYKVACIGGSTTITVRSSKAKIHGDLGLSVSNAQIASSLPSVTVSLEGFSVDVGGVPSQIESLLRDKAREGAEKALASAIRSKVPPIANRALAGLVADPLTTELLGSETSFAITPKQIAITPDELFVGVETTIRVAGGEGGTFMTTPTALAPGSMQSSQGLGLALDDDAINQLFAGLWSADAFDKSVSLDSIPTLGALLDDNARSLDLKLSLPPTVSTAGGELELAIGDLIVTVRDEAGAEVHTIAISVRTLLEAEPSQSGKILLTVGAPTVVAQVLANSAAVEQPLTDSEVEALVTAVWGLIGVKADDALSKLPMPTIAGISLGAPTVTAGDGFVFADMAVQ